MDSGSADTVDRVARARPQDRVLADERAVEIDRERGERPGEVRRELQ
jgi:hypothetical protein